jgi:hypothetical protein
MSKRTDICPICGGMTGSNRKVFCLPCSLKRIAERHTVYMKRSYQKKQESLLKLCARCGLELLKKNKTYCSVCSSYLDKERHQTACRKYHTKVKMMKGGDRSISVIKCPQRSEPLDPLVKSKLATPAA